MYKYSYLTGSLIFFIIWLILFLKRKDTRKEIMTISILFGIAGLIVDPIYSSDWWFPLTVTNTIPGIESFIFGFTVGGIASIVYLYFSNKKLKNKNSKKQSEKTLSLVTISLLSIILFFGSFFIIGLNSFHSSLPALIVPTLIIWAKRKDLILNSIVSGLLITIISIPFYLLTEQITPGWIASAWNFQIISGITFLKIPLEDLIWFFLAGILIGPLYEYWQEKKLTNKK